MAATSKTPAKRALGAQLARLQTTEQDARTAHREADLHAQELRAGIDRIRRQIVEAEAEQATRAADQLVDDLSAQRAEVERADLKAAGLAERVTRSERAVAAFTAQNCDGLVAELTPEAEAIRDRLLDGANQMLAADREWATMAQTVAGLLRYAPNATPRQDMATEHGLAPVVTDLKRALSAGEQVHAPIPHWHGRQHNEREDRMTRLGKLQRKSRLSNEERVEQTRLLAELKAAA